MTHAGAVSRSDVASSAIDRLLSRLEGCRRSGGGWVARCPAHVDRTPSLSIGQGEDGRVLLHCHAGCELSAILRALRIDARDLSGAAGESTIGASKPQIVATYPYSDEHGVLLYEVVRSQPKQFRQRRPDGKGGWSWNLEGVRRVLYRLPELIAADPLLPVFIVEGEKDVDNLRAAGLVATTNPSGAGKWRPQYSEVLRGRRVVIIPDNDDPGRQHATKIQAALSGIAASVGIVQLPGLPPKGDASDWLASGGTAEGLLAITNAAMLKESDVFEIEPDVPGDRIVEFAAAAWEEPEALPEGLLPVPQFDDRLLPEAFRPWLADVVERAGIPPEYTAVAVLVGASAVIGRGAAIRPKRFDDWTVVPNLWGAVVGPPSAMKSPALAEALRPLRLLEHEASEARRAEMDAHAAKVASAKANRNAVEAEMKKAASRNDNLEELERKYAAIKDPPAVIPRRYIVNDATVEKLGELLNANPRGLLHFRDELAGWFASLEKDGHENDRPFFIEAWDGRNSYTYDRVGRGTIHIEAACVSVLGGIQPGPLAQHLRQAIRGGRGDDGLIQRFQLLVFPDLPTSWRNVDRSPDAPAYRSAVDVFRRLDRLTPDALAVPVEARLPIFRFAPAAQDFVDGWREGLINRLRKENEHPAVEAHLYKFQSLLPSVALICHLADAPEMPPGPVGLVSAQRAAAWCDLLERHARRVYRMEGFAATKAAQIILGKLRGGNLPRRFSKRDVYRPAWSGLTDADLVDRALILLEEHGWVRRTVIPTAGAPRIEFTAHPSVGPKGDAE